MNSFVEQNKSCYNVNEIYDEVFDFDVNFFPEFT